MSTSTRGRAGIPDCGGWLPPVSPLQGGLLSLPYPDSPYSRAPRVGIEINGGWEARRVGWAEAQHFVFPILQMEKIATTQ